MFFFFKTNYLKKKKGKTFEEKIEFLIFDKKLIKNGIFKNWFKCEIDGNYINIAYVCDRIENCVNGEDEFNCSYPNDEEFHCKNKRVIDYKSVCNFIEDCKDGADEEFCGL